MKLFNAILWLVSFGCFIGLMAINPTHDMTTIILGLIISFADFTGLAIATAKVLIKKEEEKK